jgi:hypothetical protein
MKTYELRIGNLVSRKDLGNGYERVESVIYLGEKVVTSGPIKVICEYESIEPISLTNEWFERLGFGYRNENGQKYYHIYSDELGDEVQLAMDDDEFAFYLWWNDGKYERFPSQLIKYVHQLQNLYFALTGEELAIKQILK